MVVESCGVEDCAKDWGTLAKFIATVAATTNVITVFKDDCFRLMWSHRVNMTGVEFERLLVPRHNAHSARITRG